MKDILLFCSKYMKAQRNKLSLYILLCIFLGLFSLATPYISGDFVDYLISGHSIKNLLQYCFIYFSIAFTSVILGYVNNRLYISLQTRMGFELNRDVIFHIQHLPLSYIETQDSAYQNQRVNNDSNALTTFCISIIQSIVINLVTIILSFAVVCSFDLVIALSLFALIPCYFAIFQVTKKRLYESSFSFKEQQSEFFSKLFDQLSHIKQLKLNAICTEFILRLNYSFERVLQSALRYQKISYIFTGLDSIILSIAHVFLFIYGGIQVLNGSLSVGQFTIISSYFGIMLTSTRYFFSLGKNVQDNMVAYNRLKQIMSISPDQTGITEISSITKISAQNITKAFGEKRILDSLSIEFHKGNIYVIKGANGSGKTTLINALLGLYIDECPKCVMYNDQPVENVNLRKAYRQSIGIVEQEPVLFEDSIEFNITLGAPIQDKELEFYIHLLGLDGFINNLPNKLLTLIGENASNISGGEKQKICLVRALLKDPDVLVLDEPTSALDAVSAENLKEHLVTIKKEKIIIIVTHDNSFNSIADSTFSLPVIS